MAARRTRRAKRRGCPAILDVMRAHGLARRAGRRKLERELAEVVRWFHENRNPPGLTDLSPLGPDRLWALVEEAQRIRPLPEQ